MKWVKLNKPKVVGGPVEPMPEEVAAQSAYLERVVVTRLPSWLVMAACFCSGGFFLIIFLLVVTLLDNWMARL